LFDFLARRASLRPFSVEEVANAMSQDDFYSYWEGDDGTLSSNAVKNNVNRIRVALRATFSAAALSVDASKVVSSEIYQDTDEPLLERTRLYRFKGRAIVEHIP
jgi:hypothetical protein